MKLTARIFYPLTKQDGSPVIMVLDAKGNCKRAYGKGDDESDEDFRAAAKEAIQQEFKNKVSIKF